VQIAAGRPTAVLPRPSPAGSVIRSGDSGGSAAPVTIQVLRPSVTMKQVFTPLCIVANERCAVRWFPCTKCRELSSGQLPQTQHHARCPPLLQDPELERIALSALGAAARDALPTLRSGAGHASAGEPANGSAGERRDIGGLQAAAPQVRTAPYETVWHLFVIVQMT
jgi:hypothetical protein